ncbi:MAG: helix-turn-helix domain-containing protein [Bacteroidetes bacterium]|nr:helix-turn-helix domain-containing protein [Bacteroidota bacterium]
MKELSRKILEMAALGGPFFSRLNLQIWVGRISPGQVEDALKEGLDDFVLHQYSENYYYFRTKNKLNAFLEGTTSDQRKRFLRDRIQKVLDTKREPFDILAIMAMQLNAKDEAVDFWIKATLSYLEFAAWYPAGQSIDNAKLILLDETRTEELKKLESLLKTMVTEFSAMDPLHGKNIEKAGKFRFPVKVAEKIDLNVIHPEDRNVPEMNEMEKAYILHTLDSVNGNKTRASKLLGMNRTTLIMKMKRLGLM